MGLSDSVLVADLRRFWERTSGTHLRRLATCLRVPGVQAVVVLRFGQWALRRPAPLRMALARLYLLGFRRMRGRWGIEIPRRTSIGPGLYIGHAGGIVVSPEAVIGARVALSHGVTIGVANRGDGVARRGSRMRSTSRPGRT